MESLRPNADLFSRTSRQGWCRRHDSGKNRRVFAAGLGDVFAVVRAMARREPTDHLPGGPLDVRRLPSGVVVLVMNIVGYDRVPAAVELVIRCEPDGQMFAAIGQRPIDPPK